MEQVHIRAALPGDRTGLIRMHRRCSADTVRHRWHGPRHDMPAGYLDEALAADPAHLAAIAEAGARLIALGSLRRVSHEVWELAVLVEDAWQRRGVGRAMTAHLVTAGVGRGVRAVLAEALPTRADLLRGLADLGNCRYSMTCDSAMAVVDLRIPVSGERTTASSGSAVITAAAANVAP